MCEKKSTILLTEKQQKQQHKDRRFINDIDDCIAIEITQLIANGIRILESCCGHGKKKAWALIMAESHDKAIDMGYDPKKVAEGIYKIHLEKVT